jgi:hypothetical protein
VLKATEEIADTPTSRSRDYKTTAICDTASAQAKTRPRFPCAATLPDAIAMVGPGRTR